MEHLLTCWVSNEGSVNCSRTESIMRTIKEHGTGSSSPNPILPCRGQFPKPMGIEPQILPFVDGQQHGTDANLVDIAPY
jgi:hypothetical protein